MKINPNNPSMEPNIPDAITGLVLSSKDFSYRVKGELREEYRSTFGIERLMFPKAEGRALVEVGEIPTGTIYLDVAASGPGHFRLDIAGLDIRGKRHGGCWVLEILDDPGGLFSLSSMALGWREMKDVSRSLLEDDYELEFRHLSMVLYYQFPG